MAQLVPNMVKHNTNTIKHDRPVKNLTFRIFMLLIQRIVLPGGREMRHKKRQASSPLYIVGMAQDTRRRGGKMMYLEAWAHEVNRLSPHASIHPMPVTKLSAELS